MLSHSHSDGILLLAFLFHDTSGETVKLEGGYLYKDSQFVLIPREQAQEAFSE